MKRRTTPEKEFVEKKYSLGKTMFELGMRYGVWRRDIEAYIAVFPVDTMANQWIKECSFPQHSEVHDFLTESATPTIKGYKKIIGKANPSCKPKRKTSYSPSYYEKVISKQPPIE